LTAATPTRDQSVRLGDAAYAPRRSLQSDLEWLSAQLTAAVDAQPFAAVGAAAAIGFVLGGGLTRAALGVLIQMGSQAAANWLGQAIQPPGPDGVDANAQENRR
jgi:hypothetical protein